MATSSPSLLGPPSASSPLENSPFIFMYSRLDDFFYTICSSVAEVRGHTSLTTESAAPCVDVFVVTIVVAYDIFIVSSFAFANNST